MRTIIIEDEPLAADKLTRYLQKYDATLDVLAKLPSVTTAVEFLRMRQKEVDLIFMDIQLGAELSFEIFQQVHVEKPVIFITAYDEYAIDAFKVNSIDYILKPVTYTQLSRALNKFKNLRQQLGGSAAVATILPQIKQPTYKDRFLVRRGNHIHSIPISEIACFAADGRLVSLYHREEKKYILDFTLSELENMVDPKLFFRANRTFILHLDAIQDVVVYSNSRLKVKLSRSHDKEIIVSRDKVGDFKQWLAGGGGA